ncbi:MAG: hypothetical protein ABR929_06320 [Roseiarcus sp.]
MGQSEASTSVWRYNVRMAVDAKHQAPKTLKAPADPANKGFALTPEELAEFIDSIEYDEAPAAVADCVNYDPEYND